MHITLLEPFFTGSHSSWANGLKEYSSHEITIHSLSGENWKWRMQTAALEFAKKFESKLQTDCILCSSMMDVPLFLAKSRAHIRDVPVITYFHENQLSYPWSKRDRHAGRDQYHLGLINIKSALVSDLSIFNSEYHRKSFFKEAEDLLKQDPDVFSLEHLADSFERSKVIPVGVDFSFIDNADQQEESEIPVILWNHRWDYDKNPELFFEVLLQLADEGLDFQLIVVGEQLDVTADIFLKAKDALKRQILHWGYVESKEQYAELLLQSDILPVTSKHDFFGISVVEAIYAGCYPLLPDRLSYPQHIPSELHVNHLYRSKEELAQKLRQCLSANNRGSNELQNHIRDYRWDNVIRDYDQCFSDL